MIFIHYKKNKKKAVAQKKQCLPKNPDLSHRLGVRSLRRATPSSMSSKGESSPSTDMNSSPSPQQCAGHGLMLMAVSNRSVPLFQRNQARQMTMPAPIVGIPTHRFQGFSGPLICGGSLNQTLQGPQISGTVQQCRFRILGAPWKRGSKITVQWRPIFIGIGLQPWLKALFSIVSGTDKGQMMIVYY